MWLGRRKYGWMDAVFDTPLTFACWNRLEWGAGFTIWQCILWWVVRLSGMYFYVCLKRQ